MEDKLKKDLERFRQIVEYNQRFSGKLLMEQEPEEDPFAAAEGEEGEDPFGAPEEVGAEGGEDPFGTATEFTATDDIEADEEVEEIDVTQIVQKTDDAKESADKAAESTQEIGSYIQHMMDKFDNLEAQLNKLDSVMKKVDKIESDIKTPEEQLELRSLTSFPYNQSLSDYWTEKTKTDDHYKISDGEQREFKLTMDDVENYSVDDIKNSFNPLN